ncbi:MAG TPA: hypothetical protein VGZ90_12285 [Puia sp.]|nr:hypothetical protein [Puia sp.]
MTFIYQNYRSEKEFYNPKKDSYKAILLAGFVQFIAILDSVLAIIRFMN